MEGREGGRSGRICQRWKKMLVFYEQGRRLKQAVVKDGLDL